MGKIIGKVIATEKNPSTIDEFYFWTNPKLILNPFDVVKVNHINNSISYGVIEEISHITDTASFLTNYISNDFGDVNALENTHRIGMNYVRAKVIGNTDNIYIPLLNNEQVHLADANEISHALGLANMKNPILCGYLEMYNGADAEDKITLPVNMDARFLIGPEGAHLNISGISGLAAKTSYAMFLLKSIQDKCIDNSLEIDNDVAFVLFNVKGKDLLALDEPNEFESREEKEETFALYDMLGMSKEPFKNVTYYYPYSNRNIWNTYQDKGALEDQQALDKAFLYKYEYEDDKDNLDLMFASLDDPTQSTDSIINYIISNQGGFGGLTDWEDFLEEVQKRCKAGMQGDKEISVASWRKFNRIIRKSIYRNPIFGRVHGEKETRINDALKNIKKNEVHVIDIAKLNEDMQGFVFGDAVRTIYDLQLGQFATDNENYTPPSKIVIFIDELNKYASSDAPKSSPILRQVLDIAERGRSLGIILFAAEQFRSAIHDRVTGNCSTHAYGRTNAIEIAKRDYSYIPSVYKNMMTRQKQGEYIIQNPVFRSLLNIKFPKPIYKQHKQ